MENTVNNENQFYFFLDLNVHCEIHTKSDNIEIMSSTNDVINELFKSILRKFRDKNERKQLCI